MNASEQVLALYRAARDFTRRVVGVEALERAALDYATSRGWAPRTSTERETNLRERVAALESGIERVLDASAVSSNELWSRRMMRVTAAVAELRELVIR